MSIDSEKRNEAGSARVLPSTLQRLHALLSSMPSAVLLVTSEKRVEFANQAFCQLFGLADPPASLVGLGFREAIEKTKSAYLDPDHCLARIWETLDQGQPVTGEEVALRGGRTCLRDFAPLSAEGRLLGWAWIHLDITERRRAEQALRESEGRFDQLAEQSRTITWEVDTQGLYTFVSHVSEAVWGYRPDELVGRAHFYDIHPEAGRAAFRESAFAVFAQRFPFQNFINPVQRKDGQVVWVSTNGIPLLGGDGTLLGYRGSDTDITERKLAEDASRQANERLREADQRRIEFLGVLSHELRNPLTPIRNSLYLLERAQPGSEQARKAQTVIDRQVNHIARLVDDLLDVTRISRGKVRILRTRLDLVEVVRRSVEDHRSLLEDREVSVELPQEPVWIDGDATRLSQVLGNLLNNAAKFTPEQGRVSVSLTRREGRAVLEVADTGMGIDAETLARLFEPFAQAERSLARSRGGLGLGLPLVKGMVELHGGEVSAHSEGPGKGARFTISLPLEAQGTVAQGLLQQRAARNGRSILIIEDNMDAADSLSEVLELSGHRVAVAYDGDAGLRRSREFRPEIVICDIALPGETDGYAVACALRRDPLTAAVYLVALTGYAQPEDQRRALNAGFNAFLAKPPDIAALERLLAEAPPDGSPEGDSAVV